jgi:hypothetical protein
MLDGTDVDIPRDVYISVGLITNIISFRVVTAVSSTGSHTMKCQIKLSGGGGCSVLAGTDVSVTHIGTAP